MIDPSGGGSDRIHSDKNSDGEKYPQPTGCRWRLPLPFDIGMYPFYSGIMKTTVTIDKAGRVVIPKEIRDELHLEAGDTLSLESEGERVTLRPIHGSPLQKEHGVWVFHGRNRLSLDEANQLVRDAREQRDRRNTDERGR